MRVATFELSWLQDRGYSHNAALGTVGDRHGLQKRQRRAVMRGACGDGAVAARAARRLGADELANKVVAVDGFNCIITIEAALSGGLVLVARDGCHRDIASVHGSYRKVEETRRACELIGEYLTDAGVRQVRFFLDRPVSNSGRLRAVLEERAAERGWAWTVELVNNPDRTLVEGGPWVIASNDGWVTERSTSWFDLPGAVIRASIPDAWVLDLRQPVDPPSPNAAG